MRLRSLLAATLLGCWAAVLSGCAPKGPSPQLLAEMAKAEALHSQGCYTCLRESLAIFEKLRTAKVTPAGLGEKTFDTALLIAIREKELGIPSANAMSKAKSLLVPSRQVVFDAAELVASAPTPGPSPPRRPPTPRPAPGLAGTAAPRPAARSTRFHRPTSLRNTWRWRSTASRRV